MEPSVVKAPSFGEVHQAAPLFPHHDSGEITEEVKPNLKEVERSLTENLRLLPNGKSPPTIYKVHSKLRNSNRGAYEPNVIAIGPYHSGKKKLKKMEMDKLQFLKSFLKRSGKSVEDCLLTIQSLEPMARRCYDEPVNLTPPKFIKMLVIDGCFIIEFILQMFKSGNAEDYVAPCIKTSIVRDLMLFENQIPYCVIYELYKLVEGHGDLAVILVYFFERVFLGNCNMMVRKGNIGSSNDDIRHLLELIYINLIPRQNEEDQSSAENPMQVCFEEVPLIRRAMTLKEIPVCVEEVPLIRRAMTLKENPVSSCRKKIPDFAEAFESIRGWTTPTNLNSPIIIRSATTLKEYNVKFEKANSEDKFEISFDNGTIRLPFIDIQDDTESLLRNLIAYEQYFWGGKKFYVRDVTLVFDLLINSAEDVKLLVKYGIIGNLLGSEKLTADMFNKLNEHVRSFGFFSYVRFFEKVEEHCQQRRHAWMAKFKQNHVNSPWALISIVAALVLLILTFLQTLFTII